MKHSFSWRVFFTCWLFYTIFWTPYIVREHYPAMTLAEQGTLNVERYLGWSDDIFPGPRGGAYINNNPGASLTAAIPLLLLRPILKRVDEWNQKLPRPALVLNEDEVFWRAVKEGRAFYFLLVGFVTVALLMAPATAGSMAYLCSRMIDAGVPARSASLAAILCGVATPLLFRAGHLNHNLLVADAGFFGLLLLWDPRDLPLASGRAAAAGLLAGYSLLCDYSGVVVIAITAIYVGMRSRRKFSGLICFGAGLLPGVGALLAYQWWAFGSFYHPSQQYMPATAPTSHGYRGFDWPSPALAWALFFDPRFGLFAYCPALVLAFGAPFAKRVKYRLPDREVWLVAAYFALFVAFCAANQYSWLQPLTGFRYLVPVVPVLALLAIQTAQALPRALRIVIAGGSLLQSLLIAAAHENDLRLMLHTWRERGFALLWMIRLGWAGMPATWIHALGLLALLAALIQVTFALRTRGLE